MKIEAMVAIIQMANRVQCYLQGIIYNFFFLIDMPLFSYACGEPLIFKSRKEQFYFLDENMKTILWRLKLDISLSGYDLEYSIMIAKLNIFYYFTWQLKKSIIPEHKVVNLLSTTI